MHDARHPTSPFSAQQMQQSSDATIEVAERHGSTATAAAAVESSLRLHPKMNQKNTPGHSKIKASEAPGRLPEAPWALPGAPKTTDKDGSLSRAEAVS